jgi:biotin synthase
MALPLHTREGYALMETANRLSRSQFGDKGENHFHIGINVSPCPMNCLFCSLTQQAGIFKEAMNFSEEQILAWARDARNKGADALNLMTTGEFPFKRFLEIGRIDIIIVGIIIIAIMGRISDILLNAALRLFFKSARRMT